MTVHCDVYVNQNYLMSSPTTFAAKLNPLEAREVGGFRVSASRCMLLAEFPLLERFPRFAVRAKPDDEYGYVVQGLSLPSPVRFSAAEEG